MPSSSAVRSTRARSSAAGRAWLSRPKAISLSLSTLKNCVRGFWKTLPTFSEIRYMGSAARSSPSSSTRPVSSPGKNWEMRPLTSRVRVVLPQPLRPQSRMRCPSGMVRLTSWSPPSPPSG